MVPMIQMTRAQIEDLAEWAGGHFERDEKITIGHDNGVPSKLVALAPDGTEKQIGGKA